jgi:hypothetical protein
MNLVGLDGCFGEQSFGSHAEVIVGVVGRDVALVAEEEIEIVPGDLGAKRFSGEKSVLARDWCPE